VRLAYAALPVSFLLLWGALASPGCNSSGSGDDGGPACQPACPDALEEPLGDIVLPKDAGDESVEGGTPCTSVCEKENLSKCPDPGCASACSRLEITCTAAKEDNLFEALIACEMTAHYTCSATNPPIPVTSDCDAQAAKVTSGCTIEAGGTDAGCSTTTSPSDCTSCCASLHTEGSTRYATALTHCACTSPGTCATQCENSECLETAPEAGSACAVCLAETVGPDGGCVQSLNEGCGADPDCVAYEACLVTYGCAKK
jgi:hypothetical protein